jgi:hypothetical protein
MQDRYAGDIGDYFKFALLRRLAPEARRYPLGVAWYRVQNEEGNEDGKYKAYLQNPTYWKQLCAESFERLGPIASNSARRSVAALQATELLGNAVFHSAYVPTPAAAHRERERGVWFDHVVDAMKGCDTVFVDPDNGLEPDGYKPCGAKAHKSITREEVRKLAHGRALVIYHHQTRRKDGHLSEIDHLHDLLRRDGLDVKGSVRARPWSPRLFILVGASDAQVRAARDFAASSHDEAHWFAADERAANRVLPKSRGRVRW